MFIEINDLKGLIIDTESFSPETDKEFISIISQLKCIFIYEHEDRVVDLAGNINSTPITLQSSSGVFRNIKQTIFQALTLLGIQLYEVAYITSSQRAIDLVIDEPVGTILFNPNEYLYENTRRIPDFRISSFKELKDIISGNNKGFFSEAYLTNTVKWSYNPLSNSGYIIRFKMQCGEYECNIIAGGRYFGQSHTKFKAHQLSHRILKSKYNNNQDQIFQNAFYGIIDYVNKEVNTVNAITRVPPRPNKRDRFINIVNNICLLGTYENLSLSLVCIKDYLTQKALGRDDRAQNVKGKFIATENVRDKHVVLIDDVITTGATVAECAKTLYKSGAREVTAVVMCVNQLENLWREQKELPCGYENCDGELQFRFFNNDNSVFFGCSNYMGGTCNNGVRFLQAWRQLNELNTLEDYYKDEDSFEGFSF